MTVLGLVSVSMGTFVCTSMSCVDAEGVPPSHHIIQSDYEDDDSIRELARIIHRYERGEGGTLPRPIVPQAVPVLVYPPLVRLVRRLQNPLVWTDWRS
jgi:hypothetical protein